MSVVIILWIQARSTFLLISACGSRDIGFSWGACAISTTPTAVVAAIPIHAAARRRTSLCRIMWSPPRRQGALAALVELSALNVPYALADRGLRTHARQPSQGR